MNTDDLIAALARKTEPVDKARAPKRTALAVFGGVGLGLALLLGFLQVRPDIGMALTTVLMKAGFAGAFAAAGLPLVLALARPGKPTQRLIWAIAGLAGVSLAAACVALIGTEPAARMKMWMGGGFPWCLVIIPVLAAPTAALMVWLVRDLAPTRLAQTGAAIGAFSGGIGAMVYAMYCPVDSVAFVTTWYVAAIALCAALGAVLVSRFLRW